MCIFKPHVAYAKNFTSQLETKHQVRKHNVASNTPSEHYKNRLMQLHWSKYRTVLSVAWSVMLYNKIYTQGNNTSIRAWTVGHDESALTIYIYCTLLPVKDPRAVFDGQIVIHGIKSSTNIGRFQSPTYGHNSWHLDFTFVTGA